jgi:hypothetical protein
VITSVTIVLVVRLTTRLIGRGRRMLEPRFAR